MNFFSKVGLTKFSLLHNRPVFFLSPLEEEGEIFSVIARSIATRQSRNLGDILLLESHFSSLSFPLPFMLFPRKRESIPPKSKVCPH